MAHRPVDAMVRGVSAAIVIACTALPASAEGFDHDPPGPSPADWICGSTGHGTPAWTIQADATAPSQPNVLLQSGSGVFPWCVRRNVALADGFVETRFKPIGGSTDQAAGIVWRWKDADQYYVARANALENNVSLYYVERGKRHTIRYADAPVLRGQWGRLRVEFSGRRLRVLLNGRSHIEIDDAHIAGAGSVGVWTKADSVTAFDDFSFGELKPAR